MAQTVKQVVALQAIVKDRPGALAGVLRDVRDAGLDFQSLAAWSEGGQGFIAGVPVDLAKARSMAAGAPYPVKEVAMIRVEGDDERGALVGVAEKLAAAGINIRAIHCSAAGGKFSGTIYLDPQDVGQAAKALGI
jgi:hypothetical protein